MVGRGEGGEGIDELDGLGVRGRRLRDEIGGGGALVVHRSRR